MAEKKELPSVKKGIEKREKKKKIPKIIFRKANVKRFFFQLWETPCELVHGRQMSEAWDTKFRRNTELKT